MISGQRYAEWRDFMAPIEQYEDSPPHIPKRSDGLVRAELREIIESRTFAQGSRLARFLRFVVENYLSGQTEQLKESVTKQPDPEQVQDGLNEPLHCC